MSGARSRVRRAARPGCFERANGGTLLLDEIGDMSIAMQAKLLRVLQEREIQRLGGTATIPVDVRVVTATNTNLEAAMDTGAFRQDLYYRVAAFPITVPPLRERPGDIRHLAAHFLNRHASRSGRSIHALSSEALRRLERYDWPGNVRELDSAIRLAVLMETTQVLQESSLPPKLFGAEAARPGSRGRHARNAGGRTARGSRAEGAAPRTRGLGPQRGRGRHAPWASIERRCTGS